MTIAAFEAQASWLSHVVGLRCSAVRTDGDAMLSLYFGDITELPDGEIEAARVITMEGAWRVERGMEVIAGSADPEDEREGYLAELAGRTLDRYEVARPGYDLILFLHDGFVVRCFPVDSLEHADEVEDPRDVEVSWWVTGDGIPDDWETANLLPA
jgi:hypothetical protein